MNLTAAYAECVATTRKRAQNFYYAFLTLPKEARQSICALYSYARRLDDIADDEAPTDDKKNKLDIIRKQFQMSMENEPVSLVFSALKNTIYRYDIPIHLLDDLWRGVTQDLTVTRYETFDDLKKYCYLVASAVGLASLRIFGYTDSRAEEAAFKMGIAMQLTNILRDISEDGERGRIYLPQEDLRRFSVEEKELLSGDASQDVIRLISFQIDRAESYYNEATKLFSYLPRRSRPCPVIMLGVYHRILREIKNNVDVCISGRISIPKWQRGMIAIQLGMKGLLWTPRTSL